MIIYIYIYIYSDEEIQHLHTFAGLWGKEVRLAGPRNKQELAVEWEAVSLQPSLLIQADMGMKKNPLY